MEKIFTKNLGLAILFLMMGTWLWGQCPPPATVGTFSDVQGFETGDPTVTSTLGTFCDSGTDGYYHVTNSPGFGTYTGVSGNVMAWHDNDDCTGDDTCFEFEYDVSTAPTGDLLFAGLFAGNQVIGTGGAIEGVEINYSLNGGALMPLLSFRYNSTDAAIMETTVGGAGLALSSLDASCVVSPNTIPEPALGWSDASTSLVINICVESDQNIDHFVMDDLTVYSQASCSISSVTFGASTCTNGGENEYALDDYYLADITVNYANIPATGTLDLSGDATESVNVSSLSGTSYTFTGIQLPADGTTASVTATFSDDLACTNSATTASTLDPCSGCITLGAATATCDASTTGADTYTVTVPFVGAIGTLTATTTSGGAVSPSTISVSDGTITISGIPEGTDWDLSVTDGGACTVATSGTSAKCSTCPTTPALPLSVITVTPCPTEATAAAQNTAADNDATLATPYATWREAVARAVTEEAAGNGVIDISFETGVHNNPDGIFYGNSATIPATLAGLNVYGNGSVVTQPNSATTPEGFVIVEADNVTFWDLTFDNFASTRGGVADITDVNNIVWNNCIFDSSNRAGDAVKITHSADAITTSATFNCCQFNNNCSTCPGGPDDPNSNASAMEVAGNSNITVDFINTTWTCNDRNLKGGALRLKNRTGSPGGPTVYMQGGGFYGNKTVSSNAADGGAISQQNGILTIDGTEFTCNSAETGDQSSGGGAIRTEGEAGLYVYNAYFSDNDATTGSLDGYGGAINVSGDNTDVIIGNTDIVSNTASRGGGIFVNNGVNIEIVDSNIDSNEAQDGGGGIHVNADETLGQTLLALWNSNVTNNTNTNTATGGDNDFAAGVEFYAAETSTGGVNATPNGSGGEDRVILSGNTLCGNTNGNGDARDYGILEWPNSIFYEAHNSTDFYLTNNIGYGESRLQASATAAADFVYDHSTGCTSTAALVPPACNPCAASPSTAATSCGGSICGTTYIDNFVDGSHCNNDGTTPTTLTCDPDVASPTNTDAILQNVTVQLFLCVGGCDGAAQVDGLDTQVGVDVMTDTNGDYCFNDLADGTYYVVFTTPAGYEETTENAAGTAGNNDSDNDVTLGISHAMTVDVNAAIPAAPPTADATTGYADYSNVDAGFYQPIEIAGMIQMDSNGDDGLTPAAESSTPYLGGALVTLVMAGPDGDCATTGDNLTYTTMSSTSDGTYNFNVDALGNPQAILPGTVCSVTYTPPAGFSAILPDDDDAVVDNTLETGNTTILGTSICPTCTASGTGALVGSGSTPTSTADLGENNFGIGLLGSIAGTVFLDNYADGTTANLNGDNTGTDALYTSGVTVTLYTSGGVQVGSPTTTDGSGNYSFTDLPAGDYYVEITPPVGYAVTTQNVDADATPTEDSDFNTTTFQSSTITVEPSTVIDTNSDGVLDITMPNAVDGTSGNKDYTQWDFGIYQPVTINGILYTDPSFSTPVPMGTSATITVYYDGGNGDCSTFDGGTETVVTTTDGSGAFSVTDLPPGIICDVTSDYGNLEAGTVIGGQTFAPSGTVVNAQNFSLPIELSSFTVKSDNCNASLEWVTTTEENASHFELEKSIDGREFAFVSKINAAGNSVEEIKYGYLDEKVESFTYYRLKMVDLDGSFEYSQTIFYTAEGCGKQISIIQLHPNPVRDWIKFNVVANQNRTGIITVTDVAGRQVCVNEIEFDSGENIIHQDMSYLNPGVYFLQIIIDGGIQTKSIKFVKAIR